MDRLVVDKEVIPSDVCLCPVKNFHAVTRGARLQSKTVQLGRKRSSRAVLVAKLTSSEEHVPDI